MIPIITVIDKGYYDLFMIYLHSLKHLSKNLYLINVFLTDEQLKNIEKFNVNILNVKDEHVRHAQYLRIPIPMYLKARLQDYIPHDVFCFTDSDMWVSNINAFEKLLKKHINTKKFLIVESIPHIYQHQNCFSEKHRLTVYNRFFKKTNHYNSSFFIINSGFFISNKNNPILEKWFKYYITEDYIGKGKDQFALETVLNLEKSYKYFDLDSITYQYNWLMYYGLPKYDLDQRKFIHPIEEKEIYILHNLLINKWNNITFQTTNKNITVKTEIDIYGKLNLIESRIR